MGNRDEQILDAAEQLFFERGYAAVTVAEIGKRAGVAASAIYRYFESKDDILGALLDRTADLVLLKVGQAHEDPTEDLRLLAAAHLEFAVDHHRLASIWAHDARTLTGAHLRSFRRRERLYADRWLAALGRRFPDQPRDDLVTLLRGLWALLMSDALHPADSRSSAGGHEMLLGVALGGIASLGPATKREAAVDIP